MSLLPACGHRLVRLCLTQGEFLHPQALNPWARHCPNLRALEVAGCGTVADEMFVGEVPELERLAFPGSSSARRDFWVVFSQQQQQKKK